MFVICNHAYKKKKLKYEEKEHYSSFSTYLGLRHFTWMMLGSGDSAWNRGPSLEGVRGERLFIQVKNRRKRKKKKKGREIKI